MATASVSWEDVDPWPELRLDAWADTRDTLHMWVQMVGKVALALAPPVNHWWGSTLRVDARGLETQLLPYRGGAIQIAFDFQNHRLSIKASTGEGRDIALQARPVAEFYREFRSKLTELGVDVRIYAHPVELPVAIPFADDVEHASYDRAAVGRFHHILVSADRVMSEFRARFIGKSSPVHLFWGGLDLAVTRFSGREAPRHPGGFPNCPDYVQWLAYSHEVSSCGYWPGGEGEGAFYSYAYPEPPGYADAGVEPAAAHYDTGLGEHLLPVTAVRTADDPDGALMSFLQSTYEAAADCAGWDRAALEAKPSDLSLLRTSY